MAWFRIGSAFRKAFPSRATATGLVPLSGLVAGIYLVTALHQFYAQFGTSLVTTVAVVLSIGIAAACGLEQGRLDSIIAPAGLIVPRMRWIQQLTLCRIPCRFCFRHLCLATWMLLLPKILALSVSLLALLSLDVLAVAWMHLAVVLPAAVVVVGVPCFWMARLPADWFRDAVTSAAGGPARVDTWSGQRTLALFLVGLSCGMLLDGLVLAAVLGVQRAALSAAALGCGLGLVGLWCQTRRRVPMDGEKPAESSHGTHTEQNSAHDGLCEDPSPLSLPLGFNGFCATSAVSDRVVQKPLNPRRRAAGGANSQSESCAPQNWRCENALASGCAGLLTAGLGRMTHQLFPVSEWLVISEWACLLAGVGSGLYFAAQAAGKSGRVRGNSPMNMLVLSAWAMCLILTFPLLVHATLTLNAFVSHVGLMVLARLAIVGIVFLPVGNLLARATGLPSLVAFAAGYCLSRWFLLPGCGTAACVMAAAWLLLAGAAVLLFVARRSPQPGLSVGVHALACLRGRLSLIGGAALVGFVLVGPLWRDAANPSVAAKLLFDTNVFLARQMGQASDLLPVLDDGRCVSLREGDLGTLSLWKYRGSQLQLRESGIPKSVLSTDTRVCPHYAPEILHAVVPLVLHDKPRRMLVLGLGGGATLAASLAFPLHEITCVEADAGLTRFVRHEVASHLTAPPLADDRVRVVAVDPILAVRSETATYDVILCNPDQAALWQSLPYFTTAYYQQAARRLSAEGIFCQRFRCMDFGPRPLAVISKTMRAAFRDVAAVEASPGEMLFLATNSARGLVRPELLIRICSRQVRHVLSDIGWDWSVLLKLLVYDNEAIAQFANEAGVPPRGPDSGETGWFAFQAPLEMMRWGAKLTEVRESLLPRVRRMTAWIGDDADDPLVQRRIKESGLQRELMVEHPDQYWAYRKTVKEELSGKPRSLIRQVSGSDETAVLTSIDRRRLRYFETLGEVATRPNPTADDIHSVAEFASPYDPLISYFLHQEVAEISAKSAHRDPQQELPHRLHAIYFSSPQDGSVRNVVAALELLIAHPNAVPDPLDRWDHFHGLLEMLRTRWNARAAVPPKSTPILLNDIDNSVAALESTFAAMDHLAGQIGNTPTDWTPRRQFLEKTLVRPLRSYRGTLLTHHHRTQQRLRESKEVDGSPDTTF